VLGSERTEVEVAVPAGGLGVVLRPGGAARAATDANGAASYAQSFVASGGSVPELYRQPMRAPNWRPSVGEIVVVMLGVRAGATLVAALGYVLLNASRGLFP